MPQSNMATTGQSPPSEPPSTRPHRVIRANLSRWRSLNRQELWRYRELAFFFAVRDLKLRYKQTGLGILWTVLQPILSTGVFSVLFGKMVKIDSNGVPYALFCFAAIVPWNYFSSALGRGAPSLVSNINLLNKIFFPRILIPITSLLPGLVDLAVGYLLLLPLAAAAGFWPSIGTVVALPLLATLLFLLSLGFTLWLSALNVYFRDVCNLLPFMVQTGMFLTPVIYPSSVIPAKFQWLYSLNPMVGIIGGFRSALFGLPWNFPALVASVAICGLVLAGGLYMFTGMERTFVDRA